MGNEDVNCTAMNMLKYKEGSRLLIAAVIKPEGRGFNSHPGQSFPLSLYGPNSINKANAHIRSDEGLTLETSAFQIFHGGNSTFINSFDKTEFLF